MIPPNPQTLKQCLCLILLTSTTAQVNAAIASLTPNSDIPPGLGISSDGSAGVRSAPIASNTLPEAIQKGGVAMTSDKSAKAINQATATATTKPTPLTEGSGMGSGDIERIIWDKAPMAITLSVGMERMVTFPGAVRLGIPNSLNPLLRSISQNGTVYWQASNAFAATRIQVQDTISGQFYLVDLSATTVLQPNTRIEIINTSAPASSMNTNAVPELLSENPDWPVSAALSGSDPLGESPQSLNPSSAVDDYTLLTRHAAQQLYAPARLLKTPHGIHLCPLGYIAALNSEASAQASSTLIRGGKVKAMPVAAWRKGSLYVTAIKLENLSLEAVDLDPRLIRGQWRTATFQHARLGAKGLDDSVTALYLISDRPFAEVQ